MYTLKPTGVRLFGHVPLFNFWLDHHFGAGVDAVVAYATGPLADAQLQARLNADPRVSVVSWPLHQRMCTPR